MIRRFIGCILVAWSGMVLLRIVARITSGEKPPLRGSMYGHETVYAQSAAAAQATSFILAVVMLIGGLVLVFSRREYSAPEPEKKRKRRRIVVPKPPDEL